MNLKKALTIATGLAILLAITVPSLAQSQSGGKHGRYTETVIKKLNLDEQQQALLTATDPEMFSTDFRGRAAMWEVQGGLVIADGAA